MTVYLKSGLRQTQGPSLEDLLVDVKFVGKGTSKRWEREAEIPFESHPIKFMPLFQVSIPQGGLSLYSEVLRAEMALAKRKVMRTVSRLRYMVWRSWSWSWSLQHQAGIEWFES